MASISTITPHDNVKTEHLFDVTVYTKSILTTVTHNPSAVTEWINGVCSDDTVPHYIGFEVELIPGDDNTIGTLQFCVRGRCLVIQLLHLSDFPPSLNQFLSNSNHTFVAVNAEWKINLLTDQCPSVEGPVAYKDLGEATSQFLFRPELVDAGQDELFTAAFDVDIEKPESETDWGREMLTEAQVQYASLGAFASFELGRRLITKTVLRLSNMD